MPNSKKGSKPNVIINAAGVALEPMNILLTNDDCFSLNFIHIIMTKACDGAISPQLAKNGHEALTHVQNSLNKVQRQ